MLRITELSFFSLIQTRERRYRPLFLGSIQDISAVLDVMLVTVSFAGLPGTKAMGEIDR